jgi:hypothetical protein
LGGMVTTVEACLDQGESEERCCDDGRMGNVQSRSRMSSVAFVKDQGAAMVVVEIGWRVKQAKCDSSVQVCEAEKLTCFDLTLAHVRQSEPFHREPKSAHTHSAACRERHPDDLTLLRATQRDVEYDF